MEHEGPTNDHGADAQKLSPWEAALPRFSLHRPVTVLVLLATVLVVGLVAMLGIQLELFPQGFTESFLMVSVPWQDAPPQEVLEKITLPLEEELGTVRGLARLTSVSFTGASRIFMGFKQGTDMDVAYREVRDRIQRARPRLPDDADRSFIRKHDTSGIPIFVLGVAIDADLTDSYNLIQNEIVLPIERIDGVASVTVDGLEEKEILIELDRERTQASGLNIYQLAQDLGRDNFTLASGNVHAGDRKLLLRSVARYEDLEALENRILSPSVRLKDVATVKYEEPEKEYSVRVNSKPAYALVVMKEGQANTLEVAEAIAAKVEEMKANPRLARIEKLTIFNQGETILESLSTLLDSGRVGALFAMAVLFFFLRRVRMTLIITLSIPLSVMIAVTVMFFAGETLNLLTLLGLMVSVGLLVDNSVVVAENIHRLHRAGLGRREAAIQGAGQIALAIVMATLTTVAVFLPVSLIPGDAQFFLLRLSIPISVSLLGSLVVALVFVPLSAYLTLPPRGGAVHGGEARKRFDRWHQRLNGVLRRAYDLTLEPVNQAYNRVLARSLVRRLDVCVLVLLLLAGTFGFAFKGIEFFKRQENEATGFEIDVELPDSTTFADAQEYFLAAEKVLAAHQEEWGLEGYFLFHRRTFGEVQGWLNNPRTTDLTPQELTEKIVEALPETPGVKLYTGEEDETGDCEQETIHCIHLYGEDAVQLAEVADELEDVFRQVDGVVGVKKSGDDSPSELGLVVDRDRSQRQGVNPEALAGVVSYALRGQSLPKYYRDGKEIPVRVRFQEENRESLAELRDFAVPTAAGGSVALGALTDVELLPSPTAIVRRDNRVSRTLTLELAAEREEETRELLGQMTQRIDLPEGMSFGDGVRQGVDENALGLVLALGLSIVFIYLLMGFLFESFILPLSILLTIPLASIGVGWIHFFAGLNLDFLGVIGAILLIGVVVNNGIVLVDYVNRLRAEGMERTEAILRATERRFRPIMMTALTTICATVPLTLGGQSNIGLSYTSFGMTLIGGMTTSTFLTLLVVPVFYTLFDDLREFATVRLRAVRVRREVPALEAEA